MLILPWMPDHPQCGGQKRGGGPQSPGGVNGPGLFPGICGLSFPTARSLEKLFIAGRGPGAGVIWALRDSRLRAITLWGLLLTLGIVSWGFRLFPFRPDHFAIILFLPVCLIAVHGSFGWSKEWRLSTGRKRLGKIGWVVLGSLCWWGLMETATIIRPVTVLAGPEDLRALRWIKEKTPPQARFLINGTHWEWNLYRGTDGGWWITPLTGRWTSLPTLFYGFGGKDLIEEVNRRVLRTLTYPARRSRLVAIDSGGRHHPYLFPCGRRGLAAGILAGLPGTENGISSRPGLCF